MPKPPSWALAVASAVRYHNLRPWQPRSSLHGRAESLAARVKRLRRRYTPSKSANAEHMVDTVGAILVVSLEQCDPCRVPTQPVKQALLDFGVALALQNEIIFDFPKVDLTRSLTSLEAASITDRLVEVETHLDHEQRIHDLFYEYLARIYIGLAEVILPPSTLEQNETSLSVPLFSLAGDTAMFVMRLLLIFIHDLLPDPLDEMAALALRETRIQLYKNILDFSHLTTEQAREQPHRVIGPDKAGLSADQLISTYLSGTPLQEFAQIPVPFAIPDNLRSEHALIIAASGTGKTQLIQHDIVTLLERIDPPGMVVIDSQGQMLKKIERLACFDPDGGRLRDRLIIIDPEDEAAPALNMFVMPERVTRYDRNIRETIEAGTLQLFNFIFAALSQELTGRQSTAFSFVTRLMLTVPGATLRTLRQLLEDNSKSMDRSPFASHIGNLDEDAQAFFKNQFFESGYAATKSQIVQRLYGVLRVPAFNRMFGSTENKLDLFQALQDGKIILFNTSKGLLGDDASSLFGRYAIALAIRAAFERVAAPEPYRLALLYIDEAKEYFKDVTLDNLLTQVRKYNMGAMIAFQNLDQLPPALRPVVLANTSIKLCAGVSDHDARMLARDMRTTPEMLLSLKKYERQSEFACYLRNETPQAVRLTIPFGKLEAAPKMSSSSHAKLRAENRRRVAATAMVPPATPLEPTTSAPSEAGHSTPASEW